MMTDDEARQNMTAHEKEITVAEKSNEDTKYVLVPREPNKKMIAAALRRDTTEETDLYASIYRAMIAAAPALPSTSEEVAGMVKRLQTYIRLQSGDGAALVDANILKEAATLLEALDAELRALRTERKT